jgi:hypothetical protein
MPDGVIAALEAMAAAEKQPIMGNGGPVFEWGPGITILDMDKGPIMWTIQNKMHTRGLSLRRTMKLETVPLKPFLKKRKIKSPKPKEQHEMTA